MKKSTLIKRILLAVVAVLVLLPVSIVLLEIASEPGADRKAAAPADPAAQLRRGEYLALAGNCMGCHTTLGGKVNAGGRAIETPFGVIYTTNITPDQETGIGNWSADDFWRAIHNGKSRDGSFLYPAFPYPSYTKVTREDSDAMYAYLRSLPAVRQPNRAHGLRFPYNNRILLAFWRHLYFIPGEFKPQAHCGAEWNRGAYLVQGLGHCAACHTARDALGGTLAGNDLAGGMIPMQDWYASSLTSETGTGDWSTEEIADLLHTGVAPRGAVFGPMAEVVARSLQHLTAADARSMAVYIKSLPRTPSATARTATVVPAAAEAMLKQGAQLYKDNCAQCHGADGRGVPRIYPPLAGNRSLADVSAINPVRMVLNGGFPPSTGGNPRPYGMPPFGVAMSDAEVAAVVSFIRTSWGNKGTLVSADEVSNSRGAPVD
jgi:mono/diheme cytochrome c family protein